MCNMVWAGRRDHLIGDTPPRQDMPASASMFGKVFFGIPSTVDSASPRALLILPPPPSDDLHTKEPLKVYAISLGRPIAEIPRMIYCLLRSMKSKLMAEEAFVMFFPVTLEINGGS